MEGGGPEANRTPMTFGLPSFPTDFVGGARAAMLTSTHLSECPAALARPSVRQQEDVAKAPHQSRRQG